MNKEEFLKAIMKLPKVETNNPISAMNSINIDDLMSAIDRLNKVPTYDELLKENKQLKSILTKLSEWLKETRINSAFIDEQTIMEVQLKIQELEQGSDSNEI